MANSQTRNAEDFAANTQGRKKSRGRKPLAKDEAQRGNRKPIPGQHKTPQELRKEAEAEPGELDER